jgi:predicted solute-binding protein
MNSTSETESVDRSLSSVNEINQFNIPHLYKQIVETREFHEKIKNDDLQKYYENLI